MLYSSTEHEILKPGKSWTCRAGCGVCRIVVVAVDAYPGGIAANVVIEVANEAGDSRKILAPIAWDSLEPDLDRIIATDLDTSEHLADYAEWKRLANEGQAGVWTCSVEKIVQTVCGA